MEQDTPTFKVMNELIGTHGLSEEFIWVIIGPTPHVLYSAVTGYVEYLGFTLNRLQRVLNACRKIAKAKDRKVTVKDFVENQVLVMDTDSGSEYKRAGEFIADGMITAADAMFYSMETTRTDIEESQGLIELMKKPSPPSKYQPVLRAVHKEDPNQ